MISERNENTRRVFDAWVHYCKHPTAKLTADRVKKIHARFADGYSVAELVDACRGAAKSAYVDSRGHKWDDLTLICRDGSHLERFIAAAGPNDDALKLKFTR